MTANLEDLKKKILPVAQKYGVKAVYLFGSFARGDATADSDYDLFIHKGDICGFINLMQFETAVEKVLDKPVDIVTSGINNQRLLNAIDRDKVLLYER